MINNFKLLLASRPVIGVVSSGTVSVYAIIEKLSPVLQFAGLSVALAIGIVTLLIKLTEYRKLRVKRRK